MKAAFALLALAAATPTLAAPSPNFNRGTPIAVTVTNDRFIPDRINLRRGRAYAITIRNASDRRHNFSAPDFFGLARVAPRDGRLVSDNKVDLRPGQRATIRIIAPDTPNAVYRFRSTNLLDAAEKLKGNIYVR
ncbi:cupredoxin domain-containing protein [Sphingomonas jatrophae]|uniref:Cupredoxin-like domain-containing protein n=1 Tax=Sphingomonas jatrophae TaxID=1166337 RepID=A0A1I6LBJ2_9SPHN|nr:cupredoxin domain-containing protein [Sphingomonas jatrophae]SFS00570.1 Cupredoxin-like domain-containing protein [Sphingomonas jatrophae]